MRHLEPVPTVGVSDVPLEAVVLDVREDDEWAAGHAPGALHVPLWQLPGRLAEVPQGSTVYVVCRLGPRSEQATALLCSRGVDAVNVDGGMRAWSAAGRPMEAAAGIRPSVI